MAAKKNNKKNKDIVKQPKKTKVVVVKSKAFAQFDSKQFYIGQHDMSVFYNASMSAGIETEDKEKGKEKPIAETKNKKAREFSLTIPLNWIYTDNTADKNRNKSMRTTVKSEADWWISAAEKGLSSYFYVGKKMWGENRWKVTGAELSNININRNGVMTKCEIAVTFKEDVEPISKKDAKALRNKAGGLMKTKKASATRKRKIYVKKKTKKKT